MQRKALRRGKNLAFIEDICLEKERVRSKVTPRKVGVGLKWRREPSRRRLAWWGSTEKKEASHLLELRGRHQYLASAASQLGARHLWEVVENKPASSLVVSLGKALNGTPRLYVEDR